MPSSNTISNIAFTLACLAFVGLAALNIVQSVSPPSLPTSGISDTNLILKIEDAQAVGSAAAPLTVVEFSDFECPFCAQFDRDTYSEIKRSRIDTGQVRYVVMNLPLPNHRFAPKAAEAVECAAAQGHFWTMRHRLFANQHALTEQDLLRHASLLGLNASQFESCLGGLMTKRVNDHIQRAREAGVRNTPVFLIGTRTVDNQLKAVKRIVGAQPLETFQRILEDTLLVAQKASVNIK